MQQTITSRENWLRFLRGETPQWMPLVSEVQFIHPAIVPDNMARGAVMENQKVSHDQFGGPDMYGVQWVYDPVVGGSMEAPAVPPILKAIEDWPDVIHFPDIDSWDWEEPPPGTGITSPLTGCAPPPSSPEFLSGLSPLWALKRPP